MNESEIMIERPIIAPKRRRKVLDVTKEYPSIYEVVEAPPSEDTIRTTAYFIWEANKDKSADACWMEAKKVLGLE